MGTDKIIEKLGGNSFKSIKKTSIDYVQKKSLKYYLKSYIKDLYKLNNIETSKVDKYLKLNDKYLVFSNLTSKHLVINNHKDEYVSYMIEKGCESNSQNVHTHVGEYVHKEQLTKLYINNKIELYKPDKDFRDCLDLIEKVSNSKLVLIDSYIRKPYILNKQQLKFNEDTVYLTRGLKKKILKLESNFEKYKEIMGNNNYYKNYEVINIKIETIYQSYFNSMGDKYYLDKEIEEFIKDNNIKYVKVNTIVLKNDVFYGYGNDYIKQNIDINNKENLILKESKDLNLDIKININDIIEF